MKKTVLALALIASTSAFADVKGGKFGMGFAYSGNFGLMNTNNKAAATMSMPTVNAQYHVTDMIAIAANLGFYSTNYKDKSGLNAAGNGTWDEFSTTAWAVGLEVPLYLAKFNLLNFYVAPGGGFIPFKQTQTRTDIAGGVSTTRNGYPVESKTNYWSVYGVIGLQIALNDQLHAFGRTTIGYASGTYNSGNQDSTDSYFGLQSWSIGALFYFN